MESNHEVYTVPELAAILKIGRNAAYDLVKSGKIHSIRIGKSIRIPHAALEEFLNSQLAAADNPCYTCLTPENAPIKQRRLVWHG